MSEVTRRIEERILHVQRDLDELRQQVEEGELDVASASRLQDRYETELQELEANLEEGKEIDVSASSELSGRRLLGVGFVLLATIALVLGLIRTNTSGQTGAEGVAADVITGAAPNRDDVSNEEMEAVVAQNPDIPGMRLALADRYFFAGDYSSALPHYMYVLETLGLKDSDALANVGWMTYDSGFAEIAESFVVESLEVQPNNGTSMWYLANIRFYGLNDPEGSREPLERLLEADNLPAELRAEAERLLTEIEAAS